MTIEIIDTARQFLEGSVFGNTYLLGLFIIAFCLIIFLLARVDFNIAIILMLPLTVALSLSGIIPKFILIILLVGAGIIFGMFVLNLYRQY